MRGHARPLPGARRMALLLGALLHLIGVAAVPALHDWRPAEVQGAALTAPGEHGVPVPLHDEQHCVHCQTAGGVAAPAAPQELPLATVGRLLLPASTLPVPPSLPRLPGRARAPPQLS